MDPITVLTERDPVRLVVIEAAIQKAEDEERKRERHLAEAIANEVVSRIKIK